jgi:hypothetical protein
LRRCRLQRLDRLAKGHGIFLRFGGRQPDTPECGVDDGRIGMTFSGPAKGEYRGITSPDPGVRESNADEPLGTGWLERSERFEFVDGVLPSAHLFV